MQTRTTLRQSPELISVIIPVKNAAATLEQQLEALSRQTYLGTWEVLVVDNNSTDETADIARSWSGRLPGLRVLTAPDRSAVSYARNVGAREAGGSLLLYLDGDDVADPRWLEAMARAALEGDMLAGSLNDALLNDCKRMPWQPPPRIRTPGELFDFLPSASGANVGIWKEVLTDVGGWNNQFYWGSDDAELSWRVQLRGYRLVQVRDAIVHKRSRHTLWGFAQRAYRISYASTQLYAWYKPAGMPRSSIKIAVKTWASLLFRFPQALISHEWRTIWLTRAAVAAGRLTGSLRRRVLFL